jgi:predicted GIY-YIG superfamily endonuclease
MGTTQATPAETKNKNCIYVLELKGGYYYVGKSTNVEERFKQHVMGDGKGSSWTSKHEPLKVLASYEQKTDFDEDNKTLEMMSKYGIDKVRGGSYTAVDLTDATKREIQKKLDTAKNTCYKCHKSGHFAKECKEPVPEKVIDHWNHQLATVGHIPGRNPSTRRIATPQQHLNGACFRCGRTSHWARDCIAKFHVNGTKLGI